MRAENFGKIMQMMKSKTAGLLAVLRELAKEDGK